MDKALLAQNKHWTDGPYLNLFPRKILNNLIEKLQLREIQVLLGIRRSGKSTIFQLMINHLLNQSVDPKTILFANMEDPYFKEIWNDNTKLYTLVETAEKLTGKKIAYLFLDEIQSIEGWEHYIKSVYESKLFKKIFITGSNSSLLKSDYATLLSGRYIVDRLFPLSFDEILLEKGIKTSLDLLKHKSAALNILEDMMQYGGFPEVWKIKSAQLKHELLLNYHDSIILRDCIFHHKIRDTKLLQTLAFYLMSNNATLYSYVSLARNLQSNENTIQDFIRIFEDAFLIYEIKKFAYSLKKQNSNNKKNYCIDNGLINAVSFKFSENKGRLLENLVFAELQKAGFKEIHYFNENKECDFIVSYRQEYIALQVCFNLDETNRKRELDGLNAAMNTHTIKKGFVITYDQEESISPDITPNVRVVPCWKFFFELKSLFER